MEKRKPWIRITRWGDCWNVYFEPRSDDKIAQGALLFGCGDYHEAIRWADDNYFNLSNVSDKDYNEAQRDSVDWDAVEDMKNIGKG